MSKSKKHLSAHRLGNLMVVSGALIISAGTGIHSEAQLSGQGTITGVYQPTELQWIASETVLPAAGQPSSAGGIFAFGMLMVLVGFGIHAWLMLNKSEGKPVPVHVRKQRAPKPQVKKSRSTRRQAEVIWIERTIRF